MFRFALFSTVLFIMGCERLAADARPEIVPPNEIPCKLSETSAAEHFCALCAKQCLPFGMKQCSFAEHIFDQQGRSSCECQ